jgi:hypothetical protein
VATPYDIPAGCPPGRSRPDPVSAPRPASAAARRSATQDPDQEPGARKGGRQDGHYQDRPLKITTLAVRPESNHQELSGGSRLSGIGLKAGQIT